MKKLVIFDFDGVLADSFDCFYPLIRDGMKSIGFSLAPDQYRDFFIGNVHQSFKDFIDDDSKFAIFSKFRKKNYDKYYYNKHNKVKLFPESSEFLRELGKKYILAIASSGQQKNIEALLEENGIKDLFSLILASSATSKNDMTKEIMNKFSAKPEEAIMVTDTIGDIKVAKKLGLRTIAVTWGFQSKKSLKLSSSDFVVSTFNEMRKILLT